MIVRAFDNIEIAEIYNRNYASDRSESSQWEDAVEIFAEKHKESKYANKVREVLKQYSVPEVIGFIYGLWEDSEINEKEERELYAIADPNDEYNNPFDCWLEWEGKNPLAE